MSDDTGLCWVTEGGGCGRERTVEVECLEGETGAIEPDSGEILPVIEGGGRSCTHSGAGLWLWVVAALLARWRVLALLLVPGIAGATDVHLLQAADGGSFLSLIEVTRSAPWSVRAATTLSLTGEPAVLRSGQQEWVMLDELMTVEGGVSLAAGEWIRLGMSTPIHLDYTLYDEDQPWIRGDMTPWVTVQLSDPDALVQRGWTVSVDIPASAAADVLLSEPGSARGVLSSTRRIDALTVGSNLGVRLQEPEALPGLTWGNRIEGGVGVDWALSDDYGLTAEVFGSAPLDLSGPRGGWPAELLVSARHRMRGSSHVRVGGGVGLSPGLGSPSWRLVTTIYGDELSSQDRDRDGLPNLRDACASRPEDYDGYRDQDGCPDPDNDRDGLLDVVDACPMEPEVFNNHEDTDGCPDAILALSVTVVSEEPALLERATVAVNDRERAVLPGEPTVFRFEPGGTATLTAEAEGHEPILEEISVRQGGEMSVVLTLAPIRFGDVDVVVTDTRGQPIAATTTDGRLIPAGGARLTYSTGQAEIAVTAEGFLSGEDTVFVSSHTTASLTIVLEDAGVWLEESRLKVGDVIGFELDSAALKEDSTAALQALADWLAAHPEVLLLRVEGLADALGSPAYNHRLSIRRAESVRDWLVEAGVDAERLEAIGSGEALATGDGQDRSVRFLVVVWAEEEGLSDSERALPNVAP